MSIHFVSYIYVIIIKLIIHETLAYITVLDQGIFPLEQGSIGMQFFIDIENSHHQGPCLVNSWAKMCCLIDEEHRDCSADNIHGDNEELVEPQTREAFIYVYPTLYQYDQVGFCDFVVNFKCGKSRRSRQIAINIPFDTQFVNKKKIDYLKAYTNVKGSECETLDEDSLHDCQAVNCDLKYSGRRPYYESHSGKCVIAPVCETNVVKDLPDVVYVPKNNICRDLDHSVTLGDIYAIDTGLGVVTEPTKPASENLKILLKSNCSTISENVHMLKDMMYGKLCPLLSGDMSCYKKSCSSALFAIALYILAMCGVLLSFVCCLQTMLWCYGKWSKGELRHSFMAWGLRPSKAGLSIHRPSSLNKNVTDNLLREVIIRDLPIEMRSSLVDICQRINREIQKKKRYREDDLGSQISLRSDEDHLIFDTFSESSELDYDDRARLAK